MLTKLSLDSFKAYESASTELRPLTVCVGPNGSGKTSLLQAVEFLAGVVRGTLRQHLDARGWDYADLPHLRAPSKQFGFVAEIDLGRRSYEWHLKFGARRRPGIAAERVIRLNDGVELMTRTGRNMSRLDQLRGTEESISQTLTSSWLSAFDHNDKKRFPDLLELAQWTRQVQGYVALDPARLREPSRKSDEGLGPHGEGLAGFLRALRDREPAHFDRAVRRIRRHYRPLRDITVKQGSYGWNRIEVTERWGKETVTLNAKQVSDGLLRLLAVSAMHELPMPPSLIMIDEVENGVHPHLLGGLMEMLHSLANQGRTQVLVTSHSPIALNYVEDPGSVVLATRKSDGAATLTTLGATSGYRELGGYFDAGELWYNVGESRLLRRPRKARR